MAPSTIASSVSLIVVSSFDIESSGMQTDFESDLNYCQQSSPLSLLGFTLFPLFELEVIPIALAIDT